MTRARQSSPWDSDDDTDEDRYDDSAGYGEEPDEDEDYQDFLDREFGTGRGGSRLTPLQYATVILLLVVFILPMVLYAYAALRP